MAEVPGGAGGVPRVGAPGDGYEILDTTAAGGTAIRGGVLRTLAFTGGLLLGLISAPLIIRHLGDAEFGRYSSVLAIIAIISGLTEGGVNTVALRELAAAPDAARRKEVMRDLLGLRMVMSAAGIAIGVGFAAAAGYGGDLVFGTLLAGVGMLLAATQTLLSAVLQARLRFGLASLIDLARGVLTTVLVVALVIAEARTVAFLAVLIPAGAFALLLTLLIVRGEAPLRPAFHPSRWVPLMRETAVFAVAVAVNSLYFRVTLVMMSVTTTAAETGYFAISFRVMEVLVGVPVILTAAAFPILSRAAGSDRPRFDAGVARLFELCMLVGTLVSLSLALAAPFVVEVLTGDADHPATDVLRIQALAMVAAFVAGGTGYPLLSLHRHRETLVANLSSMVVVVVLALALTPSLGAQGGAGAAVAADIVLASVNTYMLMRRGGPRLPLGVVPIALGIGGVAWAAASLTGLHPLGQAVVGTVLFVGALAATGRFPPEVRELASARARARRAGA